MEAGKTLMRMEGATLSGRLDQGLGPAIGGYWAGPPHPAEVLKNPPAMLPTFEKSNV